MNRIGRVLPTCSGLSSHARLADTEIRLRQACEIRDGPGRDDIPYHALPGAPYGLEGQRKAAFEISIDWLRNGY